MNNVSEEKLVKSFFETKNPDWLLGITRLALSSGSAMVVTEDDVVLFGTKEPVKLRLLSTELQEQFVEVFVREAKYSYLYFEPPSTTSDESSSFTFLCNTLSSCCVSCDEFVQCL